MKPLLIGLSLTALLALAACGVDGEPEQPDRATTGISVTGSVSVGVVARRD